MFHYNRGTTFCVSIHLLMGTWVVSSSLLQQIKLLWTFMSESLNGPMISSHTLGTDLLSYICFANISSQCVSSFYFHCSIFRGSKFLILITSNLLIALFWHLQVMVFVLLKKPLSNLRLLLLFSSKCFIVFSLILMIHWFVET